MFAASSAPMPLYGAYCELFGMPASDLAFATVAYFAGNVGALLVFARLSNHVGRKPAILLALFMGSSVLGGPLVGRLRPRTAQLVGMVMLLAGVSALLWSVVSTNAFLLLASVFVCGVSQAAAYSGAMRRVLQRVRREESAGTLSAVSLLSYMGALTPNLVIGMFGGSWSFLAVVSGYVVLVAGCCTLSFVLPPHGDRGSAGRALD